MKEKQKFSNTIKGMNYIKPLSKCPCCSEIFLVTVEVEPLECDCLISNHNRRCIVECSNCKKKFVSDFD